MNKPKCSESICGCNSSSSGERKQLDTKSAALKLLGKKINKSQPAIRGEMTLKRKNTVDDYDYEACKVKETKENGLSAIISQTAVEFV